MKKIEVGTHNTNCYVFGEREGELMIIDPGSEPKRIMREVEFMGGQIVYIVNTHGHFDHIGGNEYIIKNSDAELMIHKNEADFLTTPKKNLSHYLGMENVISPEADHLLEEGEEIIVGNNVFRVILTPGHSPGGITLYNEKHKILFCGDAIFRNGIGRTDFPGCDSRKLKDSIHEKLLSLSGDTKVFPGHGQKTTIEEFKVNTWKKVLLNG